MAGQIVRLHRHSATLQVGRCSDQANRIGTDAPLHQAGVRQGREMVADAQVEPFLHKIDEAVCCVQREADFRIRLRQLRKQIGER